MLTVGLSLLYLLLHFAAYVLIFRGRPYFRTEKGIFLLHFVSAVALPFAVFALSLDSGLRVALLCGIAAAAAHGIYSISFLELWSLAWGSYSFIILQEIDSGRPASADRIVLDLGAIGDGKKDQRIQSLERLGLIAQDQARVFLTAKGRVAARFLRGLQRNTNLSETG